MISAAFFAAPVQLCFSARNMVKARIWDERFDELPNKTKTVNEAIAHLKLWIEREPDANVKGVFEKRIDINDVKHRYAITKQDTQTKIMKETGVDIKVKGKYYPDRSLAVEGVPPMFLHITATSQRGLNAALRMVQDFINNAGVVSAKEKLFDPRFVNVTVDIQIEQEPMFNVRAKLMGPGGSFIKHIHQASGCKVQLKGKGSGFIDPQTGLECEDALFFHIIGMHLDQVETAKSLVDDLVASVRQENQKYLAIQRSAPRQAPMGYNPYYAAGPGAMMPYGSQPPPPMPAGFTNLPPPPPMPYGYAFPDRPPGM